MIALRLIYQIEEVFELLKYDMILYIHFGYLAKFDILYKKDLYLQQIIEKDTGIKWKIKINDREYIKNVLGDIKYDIA